jgi:prophage regulatory protein
MHSDLPPDATGSRAIRLATVCELVGLSPATIWRLTKTGKFPRPFRLTDAATAWDSSEVQKWLVARIASRDER